MEIQRFCFNVFWRLKKSVLLLLRLRNGDFQYTLCFICWHNRFILFIKIRKPVMSEYNFPNDYVQSYLATISNDLVVTLEPIIIPHIEIISISELLILLVDTTNLSEQQAAASDLYELSITNKNQMREENAIPPLIELLSHEDITLKQYAAGALHHLATDNEENRLFIYEHHGTEALMRLLTTDQDLVVLTQVTACLWDLAIEQNNNIVIGNNVDIFRTLLQTSNLNLDVQRHLSGILLQISNSEHSIVCFDHILPIIIPLMKAPDPQTRFNAAKILHHLTLNPYYATLICELDGVNALYDLFELETDESPLKIKTKKVIAKTFWNLAERNSYLLHCVNDIKRLSDLLEDSNLSVKEYIFKTLLQLTQDPGNRQLFRDSGVIHTWIELLNEPDSRIVRSTLDILTYLVLSDLQENVLYFVNTPILDRLKNVLKANHVDQNINKYALTIIEACLPFFTKHPSIRKDSKTPPTPAQLLSEHWAKRTESIRVNASDNHIEDDEPFIQSLK